MYSVLFVVYLFIICLMGLNCLFYGVSTVCSSYSYFELSYVCFDVLIGCDVDVVCLICLSCLVLCLCCLSLILFFVLCDFVVLFGMFL